MDDDGIECAGFVFYNNFDSANLARVEIVPAPQTNDATVVAPAPPVSKATVTIPEVPIDAEFNIWTKPDCCHTEYENGNRTWFYFGVKAPGPNLLVRLNIVDLNRQGKMYSQGMAPVYRIVPGKSQWDRIRDKPTFGTINGVFTLSFKYKLPENLSSITYFAFTYPFSYSDLKKLLENIDVKYLTIPTITDNDIYYTRECVCHSLEGRNVDLITISSYHGITSERESKLANLFPNDNQARAFKFVGKKIVFISARVHPGETPSTFVFNGFLNLLLSRDDPVAQILRKLYVFKMIPFLNPDGVAQGHYRTDTKGVNLNRMYLNPSISDHPPIYAARSLIRYYHFGCEKDDITKCTNCQADLFDNNSVIINNKEQQNDGNISVKVSHMSLGETLSNNNRNDITLCKKCRENQRLLLNNTLVTDDDNDGSEIISQMEKSVINNNNMLLLNEDDLSAASNKKSTDNDNTDNSNIESGLFLYIDMHGHASKKGIFMYGNHFDDVEKNVECMLLPKLMSINNHNFHFSSCNFSERNMYLRDKRDGMSREGSGRVAVLRLTGLIKSYTLECNYNTGQLVNILPSSIHEPQLKTQNLLVPPKYTPQVFEGVGKSLGMSILDMTGQNPCTRIPHSEFHTLSGLQEWIRYNCLNVTGEFGRCMLAKSKLRKNLIGLRNQDKTTTTTRKMKTRSGSLKTTTTTANKKLSSKARVPTARKENMIGSFQAPTLITAAQQQQPSCSHHSSSDFIATKVVVKSVSRFHKSLGSKSKSKNSNKDSLLKLKNINNDKQQQQQKNVIMSRNSVNSKIKNNATVSMKMKSSPSSDVVVSSSSSSKINKCNRNASSKKTDRELIKLGDICVMKSSDGKTFVSKCKANSQKELFSNKSNNLMVLNLMANKVVGSGSEPGTSKQQQQGAYRVHNFSRSCSAKFSKSKMKKKLTLRRLASSATDTSTANKIDLIKKRRKLKSK